MNIVLTGFMGTGKSSVGLRLAKILGLKFADTDEIIRKQTGREIKDIFRESGEDYFRTLEKKTIKTVKETMRNVILSTGGGAVVDKENRDILKSWGTVVCLTASIDVILKRIGLGDERPLINGETDKKRVIERLLKQREEAYKDSHLIIDTTSKTIEAVTREIEDFVTARRS